MWRRNAVGSVRRCQRHYVASNFLCGRSLHVSIAKFTAQALSLCHLNSMFLKFKSKVIVIFSNVGVTGSWRGNASKGVTANPHKSSHYETIFFFFFFKTKNNKFSSCWIRNSPSQQSLCGLEGKWINKQMDFQSNDAGLRPWNKTFKISFYVLSTKTRLGRTQFELKFLVL